MPIEPLVAFGESQAESDTAVGVQLEADFSSRYLWNAFDFNHGDPVFQPAVAYLPPFVPGLAAGVWFTFGIGEDISAGDTQSFALDETDFSIWYDLDLLAPLILTFEFAWYYYPSDFFSGNGNDNKDLEVILYTNYSPYEWVEIIFNYKRGIDSGIEGNAIEA
ncbi:MAG: hypothetical protein MN733_22910, partial [Nitrososphaera sp.]|nr:hypothetical protein [Nitrososphaera sp.]